MQRDADLAALSYRRTFDWASACNQACGLAQASAGPAAFHWLNKPPAATLLPAVNSRYVSRPSNSMVARLPSDIQKTSARVGDRIEIQRRVGTGLRFRSREVTNTPHSELKLCTSMRPSDW